MAASEAAAAGALGLRPAFSTSMGKPGNASPGRTSDVGFQIGDLVNQMAAKLKVLLPFISAVTTFAADASPFARNVHRVVLVLHTASVVVESYHPVCPSSKQ